MLKIVNIGSEKHNASFLCEISNISLIPNFTKNKKAHNIKLLSKLFLVAVIMWLPKIVGTRVWRFLLVLSLTQNFKVTFGMYLTPQITVTPVLNTYTVNEKRNTTCSSNKHLCTAFLYTLHCSLSYVETN